MKREYTFPAAVLHVVDGDTFDCMIDLGFRMATQQRIRVHGLDTPETCATMHPTAAEREHGEQATELARGLLQDACVTIQTHRDPAVYNRYEAVVTLPDGRDFAQVMRDHGMGKRERYA